MRDKGRDWLNVYNKRYAKHEVDGLGRAVWYRGTRGPLSSSLYEATSAWDSLFIARLPDRMGKAALTALCASFGPVDHVTMNARRGYAFVRFEAVESATAALRALQSATLLGSRLHVRYKRRLRKKVVRGQPVAEATAEETGGFRDEEELEEEEEAMLLSEDAPESTRPPAAEEAVAAAEEVPTAAPGAAAAAAAVVAAGEDEDEDEWDAPCFVADEQQATSLPPVPPATAVADDPFSRSVRSFRAAGVLAPASAHARSEAGESAEGSLVALARTYNALATAELDRLGA